MGKFDEDLKIRIRGAMSREINRIAEEREVTRSEVARDLLDVGYLIMAASRDIEINLWDILQNEVPEKVKEIEEYIEEEHEAEGGA